LAFCFATLLDRYQAAYFCPLRCHTPPPCRHYAELLAQRIRRQPPVSLSRYVADYFIITMPFSSIRFFAFSPLTIHAMIFIIDTLIRRFSFIYSSFAAVIRHFFHLFITFFLFLRHILSIFSFSLISRLSSLTRYLFCRSPLRFFIRRRFFLDFLFFAFIAFADIDFRLILCLRHAFSAYFHTP